MYTKKNNLLISFFDFLALMLSSILVFISCRDHSSPQSYIKTLHDLDKNPSQWHSCLALKIEENKQDCLLFAVSKNPPDMASKICQKMEDQQDECYFLLAEQTQDSGFCDKAQRYENDCRIHLLVRKLQHRTDYEALLKELKIPTDGIHGWTAIYRKQLRPISTLDGYWCSGQKFPDFCLKSLEGLYWDRLNRYFKCSQLHPKLHTQNAPTLEKALEERKKTCSH